MCRTVLKCTVQLPKLVVVGFERLLEAGMVSLTLFLCDCLQGPCAAAAAYNQAAGAQADSQQHVRLPGLQQQQVWDEAAGVCNFDFDSPCACCCALFMRGRRLLGSRLGMAAG